jgi:hypothetical protein
MSRKTIWVRYRMNSSASYGDWQFEMLTVPEDQTAKEVAKEWVDEKANEEARFRTRGFDYDWDVVEVPPPWVIPAKIASAQKRIDALVRYIVDLSAEQVKLAGKEPKYVIPATERDGAVLLMKQFKGLPPYDGPGWEHDRGSEQLKHRIERKYAMPFEVFARKLGYEP